MASFDPGVVIAIIKASLVPGERDTFEKTWKANVSTFHHYIQLVASLYLF